MQKYLTLNNLIQAGLIFFTTMGFLLTSLKFPQYGVIFMSVAQIFWIYSSYKEWKNANQIGIFINTLITTAIVFAGVINYWFI